MKEYNFNVRFLGNTTLVVPATSREEAKEKVKNLMDGLTLKNIEEKENTINDINITYSSIRKDMRQVGAKHNERS